MGQRVNSHFVLFFTLWKINHSENDLFQCSLSSIFVHKATFIHLVLRSLPQPLSCYKARNSSWAMGAELPWLQPKSENITARTCPYVFLIFSREILMVSFSELFHRLNIILKFPPTSLMQSYQLCHHLLFWGLENSGPFLSWLKRA